MKSLTPAERDLLRHLRAIALRPGRVMLRRDIPDEYQPAVTSLLRRRVLRRGQMEGTIILAANGYAALEHGGDECR